MKPISESQGMVDHDQVFLRMRRIGITQCYLAKKLNRTKSSISYALSGKRKNLLERIIRHLDYLEAKKTIVRRPDKETP